MRAYCPYSQFAVGASLLLDNGDIVGGCNVENASYGLTMCAERNALSAAIALGFSAGDFRALMIYTPGNRSCPPCGACRQVIIELMPPGAAVMSVSDSDECHRWHVEDLLPQPFTPDQS